MDKIKFTVEHFTQTHGRSFIVGDIHGDYDQFMNLLDGVGFDYDKDICYSVGDLVDRGNKSLDCFNLLSKSWFKAVRGNHEQFCIDSHHAAQIYKDICVENHIKYGGDWFYKLPIGIQKHIVGKLNELPIALVLTTGNEKVLIVHGDIPDSCSNLEQLIESIELKNEYTPLIIMMGRKVCTLSNSALFEERDSVKEFGGVDMVYLGHTNVKNILTHKNYTFVDTGCSSQEHWGRLSIVEI